MKNRTKKFRFESLENRQMMAGDVTAFISGGDLHLGEAIGQFGQANAVEISQLSNGLIRVASHYSQTKINGQAFQDFAVSGRNLFVNFGYGQDRLVFNANAPVTLANVEINMGVEYAGAYDDYDVVSLNRLTTYGHVKIVTGASNDVVYVHNSRIGDGSAPLGSADNLNIHTGFGTDIVEVGNYYNWAEVRGNLNITTHNFANEAEADYVTVRATVWHNASMSLGGGNDTLDIVATTSMDLIITAGDGHDTVKIRDTRALDDFWAWLGEGDDVLEMYYLRVDNGHADIRGEGGYDRLIKAYDTYFDSLNQTGFEEINGVRLRSFTYWNTGLATNSYTLAAF